MKVVIRAATPQDAEDLVRWIRWAGDGMPEIVWEGLAEPGQTAQDVGLARAAREEGDFSYRNSWIMEVDGKPVAGLVGFPLPDEPVEIGPDYPSAFVPLQELENLALGHWYVNVLAVEPAMRSRGLGRRFLEFAEEQAARAGSRGMAIIAFASNPGSVRLYERAGYVEKARRVVELQDWRHSGTEAILLVKPLA